MDYHFLRELADSWVLLSLVLVFLGVIVWAFRPGAREVHEDVANVLFRHEDKPASRSEGLCPRAEDGATL